jgi:hypothetical protein
MPRKEKRRAKGAVECETYEATAHQRAEDILRIYKRVGSVKGVQALFIAAVADMHRL